MATHDYVIDNSTGANVRADINNVLQAILTNNSSSSAPSTTAAYMWWADTTSGTLKIRNSSDNAWVELLQLDGTLTLEDGSNSAPALAFRDDLDTGIYSSAANTFNVATAGVERMALGAATIFNEDGADVDFRIEGDNQANLFYVDAGNHRIGIGTNTPSEELEVSASSNPTIKIASTGATPTLFIGDSNRSGANQGIAQFRGNWNGTTVARITFDTGSDTTNKDDGIIRFDTAAAGTLAEAMRIDSSGNVGIGTTSPATPLEVRTSSDTEIAAIRTGSVAAKLGAFASGESRLSSDGTSAFWTFYTGSSPAERMRIASDGTVQIAAGGAIAGFISSEINSGAPFKIYKSSSSTHAGLQLIWDHFNTTTAISQKIQFTIGDDASADGFKNAGFIGIEKIDTWGNNDARSSALTFATTASATESEKMRIDNVGRVIIGKTSTAASDTAFRLQVFAPSGGSIGVGQTNVSASGTATINLMPSNAVTGSQIVCFAEEDFSTSANRTARLEFKTRNNGTLTTAMSLAANTAFGAVGIYNQTTSSGANVNVASDGHVRRSTSSRKYKNTITDATHGLTELLKLKSVTFKGNDDGDTVFGGLIAEDVHDAGLTEFVQYNKDNEPDALAYGNMVALCVKAIQELTARVATLESA